MRKLVWWLRSVFCKHEWRSRGSTRIMNRWRACEDPYEQYDLDCKECTRCGWIWRQRL